MPQVFVWDDTKNNYTLQTINTYVPIYQQEEQIIRSDPKISNANPPYTDTEISQFVENRMSDNYIAPDTVYAKIQMIIGILIIKKMELDPLDEGNASIVNDAITGFLNELHKLVKNTKTDPNPHTIDTRTSTLNSIVETLVNKYFNGLESFRTNYKPLFRLKSLLKHYADTYIDPHTKVISMSSNSSTHTVPSDIGTLADYEAWKRTLPGGFSKRRSRKPSSKKRTPYKRRPSSRRRVVRRRRTSTRKR